MSSVTGIRLTFARNLIPGYIVIGCLISVVFHSAMAQDAVSPRIQIGLSLFPSIVAADRNLADQLDSSQQLNLYVVYQTKDLLAQRLAQKLTNITSIRNFTVNVKSISMTELHGKTGPFKGALFLAEPAGDDVEKLTRFSQINRVLIFSSFKGDVERGIASGYQVTNKVLPLVNMQSLKQANIHLKAFFMRIAVKYE